MAKTTALPPPWLSSHTLPLPLQQLLRLPVSLPLFDYVVDRLVDTVSSALDPSWERSQPCSLRTPFLQPFVQNVLTKNRVSMATVLVALVYLERSRKNLRVSVGFWACERAFIGAMILANKYTNDDILSTKAWAIASNVFTARDVVKAEREFLQVLRYDLSVTDQHLMVHSLPLIMKFCQYADQHMALKPLSSRAPVRRYSPYEAVPRASRASPHMRRLVTRDATSSSSSLSSLDSPQVQTPPDSHPQSIAAIGSDAKRTYQPASLAIPCVLASMKHDTAVDVPVHALDARHLRSLFPVSPRGVHGTKKDLATRPLPSMPAGTLQELDFNVLPLPRSASEVRPFSPTFAPGKTKPQNARKPMRFSLGGDRYLHRDQATATPPSSSNAALFVF